MSKSWREPKKDIFGKNGSKKKALTLREEERARKEIKQLTRRAGERVETFFD